MSWAQVIPVSMTLIDCMYAARQQRHPQVNESSIPQQELMRHTNWPTKRSKTRTTERIRQTSTVPIPTDDATTQDPTVVCRRPEGRFRLIITPACLCAMDGDTTMGEPCIYPSVSSAHAGQSITKPSKSCTPPTPSPSNGPNTSPISSPISPPSPPAPECSPSDTSTCTCGSSTRATR